MPKYDSDEVLLSLADQWPDWRKKQGLTENCCILAARISVNVLSYFDVPAKAVATDVAAYTPEAWPFFLEQTPVGEWPDEAWSVGTTHDQTHDGPGYNGHVIVLTDEWLLDLTVTQFNRAERNLFVPAPVLLRQKRSEDDLFVVENAVGTKLVYQLIPSEKGFHRTSDWRHTGAKRDAGHFIRQIREIL